MTDTPAHVPTETTDGATPAVEGPPLAPGSVALCFIVDEEPSMRHFLSLVLHGAGLDTMEFADGASMREAAAKRAPAVIFHNVSLESADAIESMISLGTRRFPGAVQLMSNRGAAVLEHVKSIGTEHKLNMLPVLKKPFETEVILSVVRELKLGMPAPVASRIDLDEAISNQWIEFWYQPKIDLRKKRLAGAEAYARARHPQHGVVLPTAFMPGATEATLIKLAEVQLTSALKAGLAFSNLGINLRLAINLPFAILENLPVEAIVKAQRPAGAKWVGLTIDVPEQQIIGKLARAGELATQLERSGVYLAIDACGRGHEQISRLGELPFAELKLDRTYVTDCSTDKVKAPVCKAVIDLAHAFGRSAVAMGIEKASDAIALVSMGCDFGQGFLLGQPMPEQRFISLLRQRAATQGRTLAPAS
jgi:EAL domain-containing protein (putative c-di-GMP-specific phosphodiesterase class I)